MANLLPQIKDLVVENNTEKMYVNPVSNNDYICYIIINKDNNYKYSLKKSYNRDKWLIFFLGGERPDVCIARNSNLILNNQWLAPTDFQKRNIELKRFNEIIKLFNSQIQ